MLLLLVMVIPLRVSFFEWNPNNLHHPPLHCLGRTAGAGVLLVVVAAVVVVGDGGATGAGAAGACAHMLHPKLGK